MFKSREACDWIVEVIQTENLNQVSKRFNFSPNFN